MSGDMSMRVGQAMNTAMGFVQRAAGANTEERTKLFGEARKAFDTLQKDYPNDQAVQRSLAELDYNIKVVNAEGASSLKGLEKLQFLIQMLSPKQQVRDAMKLLRVESSQLEDLKDAAKAGGLPKVVAKRVDAKIAKLEARITYHAEIRELGAKEERAKLIKERIKKAEDAIGYRRQEIKEYQKEIQNLKEISQITDQKEISEKMGKIEVLTGEIARANDAIKESEEDIMRLTEQLKEIS